MIGAAIALMLAGTVAAQDSTITSEPGSSAIWSKGNWRLFSYDDEDMCDLGFSLPDGEYVTIGYSPKVRSANLMVTNQHATSRKSGETARLTVVFTSPALKRIVARRDLDFEVLELADRRAFSALKTYPEFLDDLSAAGAMGVFTSSGALVRAISLDHSADAVRALRSCALEAAELDPRDPFLE